MLKKRLGIEALEKVNWDWKFIYDYYKILPTLIIPDGCKKIGSYTFSGCCEILKKVIIPESVEIIGISAFYECNDAEIILKKPEWKFKSISSDAFYNCKSVEYAEEEIGN